MLDGLLALLKTFICAVLQWFVDWICAAADLMLGAIVSLIPDFHINDYYIEFIKYASWANHWVPVDWAFYLIGLYLLIKVSVQFINWILGLIPTIN